VWGGAWHEKARQVRCGKNSISGCLPDLDELAVHALVVFPVDDDQHAVRNPRL
jgi:hypothetical protein